MEVVKWNTCFLRSFRFCYNGLIFFAVYGVKRSFDAFFFKVMDCPAVNGSVVNTGGRSTFFCKFSCFVVSRQAHARVANWLFLMFYNVPIEVYTIKNIIEISRLTEQDLCCCPYKHEWRCIVMESRLKK